MRRRDDIDLGDRCPALRTIDMKKPADGGSISTLSLLEKEKGYSTQRENIYKTEDRVLKTEYPSDPNMEVVCPLKLLSAQFHIYIAQFLSLNIAYEGN